MSSKDFNGNKDNSKEREREEKKERKSKGAWKVSGPGLNVCIAGVETFISLEYYQRNDCGNGNEKEQGQDQEEEEDGLSYPAPVFASFRMQDDRGDLFSESDKESDNCEEEEAGSAFDLNPDTDLDKEIDRDGDGGGGGGGGSGIKGDKRKTALISRKKRGKLCPRYTIVRNTNPTSTPIQQKEKENDTKRDGIKYSFDLRFVVFKSGLWQVTLGFGKRERIAEGKGKETPVKLQGLEDPICFRVSTSGLEASEAIVRGLGIGKSVINQPSFFYIVACDRFRNSIPVGGEAVDVFMRFSSHWQVTGVCVDRGDGTYEATYTVTKKLKPNQNATATSENTSQPSVICLQFNRHHSGKLYFRVCSVKSKELGYEFQHASFSLNGSTLTFAFQNEQRHLNLYGSVVSEWVDFNSKPNTNSTIAIGGINPLVNGRQFQIVTKDETLQFFDPCIESANRWLTLFKKSAITPDNINPKDALSYLCPDSSNVEQTFPKHLLEVFVKINGNLVNSDGKPWVVQLDNPIMDIDIHESELPFHGWLYKKGQTNSTWKRRYFILIANQSPSHGTYLGLEEEENYQRLVYFSKAILDVKNWKAQEFRAMGSIPLHGALLKVKGLNVSGNSKEKFEFALITAGGILHELYSTDVQNRLNWVTEIERSINPTSNRINALPGNKLSLLIRDENVASSNQNHANKGKPNVAVVPFAGLPLQENRNANNFKQQVHTTSISKNNTCDGKRNAGMDVDIVLCKENRSAKGGVASIALPLPPPHELDLDLDLKPYLSNKSKREEILCDPASLKLPAPTLVPIPQLSISFVELQEMITEQRLLVDKAIQTLLLTISNAQGLHGNLKRAYLDWKSDLEGWDLEAHPNFVLKLYQNFKRSPFLSKDTIISMLRRVLDLEKLRVQKIKLKYSGGINTSNNQNRSIGHTYPQSGVATVVGSSYELMQDHDGVMGEGHHLHHKNSSKVVQPIRFKKYDNHKGRSREDNHLVEANNSNYKNNSSSRAIINNKGPTKSDRPEWRPPNSKDKPLEMIANPFSASEGHQTIQNNNTKRSDQRGNHQKPFTGTTAMISDSDHGMDNNSMKGNNKRQYNQSNTNSTNINTNSTKNNYSRTQLGNNPRSAVNHNQQHFYSKDSSSVGIDVNSNLSVNNTMNNLNDGHRRKRQNSHGHGSIYASILNQINSDQHEGDRHIMPQCTNDDDDASLDNHHNSNQGHRIENHKIKNKSDNITTEALSMTPVSHEIGMDTISRDRGKDQVGNYYVDESSRVRISSHNTLVVHNETLQRKTFGHTSHNQNANENDNNHCGKVGTNIMQLTASNNAAYQSGIVHNDYDIDLEDEEGAIVITANPNHVNSDPVENRQMHECNSLNDVSSSPPLLVNTLSSNPRAPYPNSPPKDAPSSNPRKGIFHPMTANYDSKNTLSQQPPQSQSPIKSQDPNSIYIPSTKQASLPQRSVLDEADRSRKQQMETPFADGTFPSDYAPPPNSYSLANDGSISSKCSSHATGCNDERQLTPPSMLDSRCLESPSEFSPVAVPRWRSPFQVSPGGGPSFFDLYSSNNNSGINKYGEDKNKYNGTTKTNPKVHQNLHQNQNLSKHKSHCLNQTQTQTQTQTQSGKVIGTNTILRGNNHKYHENDYCPKDNQHVSSNNSNIHTNASPMVNDNAHSKNNKSTNNKKSSTSFNAEDANSVSASNVREPAFENISDSGSGLPNRPPSVGLADSAEWMRVADWLTCIGMQKYSRLFYEQGLTRLSSFELLSFDDLEQVGISKSDQNILLNAINAFSQRTKTWTNKAFDIKLDSAKTAARDKDNNSNRDISNTHLAVKNRTLESMSYNRPNSRPHPNSITNTSDLCIAVLKAFDECDSGAMFSLLEKYLPLNARKPGNALYDFTINLEFFLRVYSLIGMILKAREQVSPNEEMVSRARYEYRRYIEEKAQFLPFFNSPEYEAYAELHTYPNPDQHSVFKNLFHTSWRESLRKRLQLFIGIIQHASNNQNLNHHMNHHHKAGQNESNRNHNTNNRIDYHINNDNNYYNEATETHKKDCSSRPREIYSNQHMLPSNPLAKANANISVHGTKSPFLKASAAGDTNRGDPKHSKRNNNKLKPLGNFVNCGNKQFPLEIFESLPTTKGDTTTNEENLYSKRNKGTEYSNTDSHYSSSRLHVEDSFIKAMEVQMLLSPKEKNNNNNGSGRRIELHPNNSQNHKQLKTTAQRCSNVNEISYLNPRNRSRSPEKEKSSYHNQTVRLISDDSPEGLGRRLPEKKRDPLFANRRANNSVELSPELIKWNSPKKCRPNFVYNSTPNPINIARPFSSANSSMCSPPPPPPPPPAIQRFPMNLTQDVCRRVKIPNTENYDNNSAKVITSNTAGSRVFTPQSTLKRPVRSAPVLNPNLRPRTISPPTINNTSNTAAGVSFQGGIPLSGIESSTDGIGLRTNNSKEATNNKNSSPPKSSPTTSMHHLNRHKYFRPYPSSPISSPPQKTDIAFGFQLGLDVAGIKSPSNGSEKMYSKPTISTHTHSSTKGTVERLVCSSKPSPNGGRGGKKSSPALDYYALLDKAKSGELNIRKMIL